MSLRSMGKFSLLAALILVLFAAAACDRRAQAARDAGPQAMPVKMEPAQVKRVPDQTEYLATLRSRNSSVLQPQVEGQITRIFVKSGDRVEPGTPLIEIDPLKQQATVISQEASQRSRLATLDYARRDFERKKQLFAAGVVSQQDMDQSESAFQAARADVDALEAGVREQRVQLHYYTVKAPAPGVVGDIPVRVGDRVTVSTVLTTLDKGGELEAYISVPSENARDVHMGMPVEIEGESSQAVRTRVTFVSPRMDSDNQLLLIKALLPNGSGQFRNAQVVRARVVWKELDRPMLPVVAVSRLGAQTFAFVAAEDGGKTVAKQRPVKLGELVGNEYVVLDGIKPGDRIITSRVQILADGMPVVPES
jgi:RND family efflux transporter MFP subunit